MDSSSVLDGVESVVDNVSSIDYSDVYSKLDEIHNTLISIDSGLKYILCVGLILIAFIAVWNIFDKWYFGDV